MLAFVETRWAAPTVFVAGVCVWWIQAIAMPLARGRDFGTYVGAYVELFQRHPIDLGYVLGRTPIAPLVTGALLDAAGGVLAEPAMSVLYALSIVAWFLLLVASPLSPLSSSRSSCSRIRATGSSFHELAPTRSSPPPSPGGRFSLSHAVLARLRCGSASSVSASRSSCSCDLESGSARARARATRPRPTLANSCCVGTRADPLRRALLGLWVVHNGVLYGKYTVATGANAA